MDQKEIKSFIEFNHEHLTKKIIYQDEYLLTFMLNLKPGQTLPRHGHEGGTLIVEVIQGLGVIAINDAKQILQARQLFFLLGKDMLEVPEVVENLSLLVTIAPNPSNPIYKKPV
ncbi:MAG TPA: cupin [Firmicutes bacterium]|jgi:hypothetical protein|nr:cupin [Bacillota bacterium]